jgi:hypothetical protein
MSGTKDTKEPKPTQQETEQKKSDRANEDSFPASDPPSTTPVAGSRKAELNQKKPEKPR